MGHSEAANSVDFTKSIATTATEAKPSKVSTTLHTHTIQTSLRSLVVMTPDDDWDRRSTQETLRGLTCHRPITAPSKQKFDGSKAEAKREITRAAQVAALQGRGARLTPNVVPIPVL